ncbi:PfaD family polyunsaturated fatty acid/polyketide biosynthesis protein [Paenibacillus qinlingensis]|uniref:PfaD family polyunsaturated fatty acid/polyketide biosynthesis protein n=1 Tax=Paenibacillus qinlingensis TaxID=1837343 RepID=UPI0015637A7D|nr:PfaD family polyunsaturated fatty acid/polyketide biosynthesis protein [Paenibacillus qinlingensis]NQX57960.1 PfaD family polyunsaturated fatty acid/polyketide biosynthesis protein [Paenibacillus qinlingensis]
MQQSQTGLPVIGYWLPGGRQPAFGPMQLGAVAHEFREPMYVIRDEASGAVGAAVGGSFTSVRPAAPAVSYPALSVLAPIYPEWLGDRSFQEVHCVRFAYIAGEMANGIATEQMVIAMARNRMLGFFGSAGLPISRVERAIDTIQAAIGDQPWGVNLIHTPNEPKMEEKLVDLYIAKNVRRISASAFMSITPAIVTYAAKGLRRLADGSVQRRHFLFAKISRPELASQFMSPPSLKLLEQLVQQGKITPDEANCAAELPIAEDITVESDSGGHTDNRPLGPLFSAVLEERRRCTAKYAYARPIRCGIAGGIGTPAAAAAAFAQGASYIMVGSVNQSAIESGLSVAGKEMLAQAVISDVTMAPAADMFEQGVKVQVMKRGTLFSARGYQLYEIYREYPSLEDIPDGIRRKIEETVFRAPLEDIWAHTVSFFRDREPSQIERAERDPKHKMALVFRWYLGNASRWAIIGEPGREMDYQIWCGPAMGAFNAWVKDTWLESPSNRTVAQIALNLLEGAAAIGRAQQLRMYGAAIPLDSFQFAPRRFAIDS